MKKITLTPKKKYMDFVKKNIILTKKQPMTIPKGTNPRNVA